MIPVSVPFGSLVVLMLERLNTIVSLAALDILVFDEESIFEFFEI